MTQDKADQAREMFADLCRVTREGDEVVIHFGQTIESPGIPGAMQADALGRIAMSEGGAARLQDLLADLLRQPLPGHPRQP